MLLYISAVSIFVKAFLYVKVEISDRIIKMKQYTITMIATNHAKILHALYLLPFDPETIHVSSNNDNPTGKMEKSITKKTTNNLFPRLISVFVNKIPMQIMKIAEKMAIAAYLDWETPTK
jgi:hypothetical protein